VAIEVEAGGVDEVGGDVKRVWHQILPLLIGQYGGSGRHWFRARSASSSSTKVSSGTQPV